MVAPRQVPSPTGVAYVPGLSEATRHELTRQASQLPQVIRYFDDYDEVERSIRAAEPEWRSQDPRRDQSPPSRSPRHRWMRLPCPAAGKI